MSSILIEKTLPVSPIGHVQTAVDTTQADTTGLRQVDFSRVYQEEFDYVWHSLRRLGVVQRHLPDVTQDVFLFVHRRLASFDETRPVKPWPFGIAFRVASDTRALARTRHEYVGEPVEARDPRPTADAQLADAEAKEIVQRALDSLELNHRAILIMHDIDELPMSEISVSLDVPVKTLYSRLSVAREKFTSAGRRLLAGRGSR